MVLLGTALFAAFLVAPGEAAVVKVKHTPSTKADIAIGAPGTVDPDRIVCRREVVGSRRDRKVCLTSLEWSRIEDAADRIMDSTLHNVGIAKPPPSANPR